MTAPDHIAKIFQKTLARGGRPHMNIAPLWKLIADLASMASAEIEQF
jgi:hypothetical protein